MSEPVESSETKDAELWRAFIRSCNLYRIPVPRWMQRAAREAQLKAVGTGAARILDTPKRKWFSLDD